MRNIVNRVIDVARPDERRDRPGPGAHATSIRWSTIALAMVEHEARRKGVLLTSTVEPLQPSDGRCWTAIGCGRC